MIDEVRDHLTRHAERRCRQRGINERTLRTFLDHHDLDVPAGAGCRRLSMSRGTARAMGGLGERLERLVVIASERGGRIVTVHHDIARGQEGRGIRVRGARGPARGCRGGGRTIR